VTIVNTAMLFFPGLPDRERLRAAAAEAYGLPASDVAVGIYRWDAIHSLRDTGSTSTSGTARMMSTTQATCPSRSTNASMNACWMVSRLVSSVWPSCSA